MEQSDTLLAFALTSTAHVEIIVVGGTIIWLALAGIVAMYGRDLGYPFWPLFISGACLPFGFAIVLLAVTIGGGNKRNRERAENERLEALARNWPQHHP